jgi:hypothetical protein
MAQPMAFRAAYSDWRLIKTRGVVQVVLEVPLADADAAYNVLGGMPDASRENWFAVAPLKLPPAEKEVMLHPAVQPEHNAQPQPAEPDRHSAGAKRMDWRELQPAAQAGIRCNDPVFIAYMRENYDSLMQTTPEGAAEAIRDFCCVESRSELGTNHKARVLWHSLDEQFQAWKLAERVGA